ncbi:Hypothetical protein A7982_06070 [Minicystis rosea]|nr:Hypothetical protein A7982_06070 [Minicystis rosea]
MKGPREILVNDRMRALLGALVLCGLTVLGVEARAAGDKVSLSVRALDFRNTKGRAIVAVFNDKDGWPKIEKAIRVEKVGLDKSTLDVTFRDLPPGTYAVEVIHDENDNGKLDMRWLPYPKPIEGAGASNDAPASLGPPSWADARFRLTDKGGAIAIHVRYW